MKYDEIDEIASDVIDFMRLELNIIDVDYLRIVANRTVDIITNMSISDYEED